MTTTNFVDSVTVINADWLNDVDAHVYDQVTAHTSDHITYDPGTSGSIDSTVQTKLRESVSVKDFGAIGDGIADDTVAIQTAYTSLPINSALYFPAGTYRYTSKLSFAGNKHPAFIGDGPRQTFLIYDGAVLNDDCIVIGNGSSEESGWMLSEMSFRTAVNTTAGALVHFRKLVRSTLTNVYFGDQDYSTIRAYIGAWFDAVDWVSVTGYQARGSQECIRVNGTVGAGPKADLFLNNGKLGGAVVGLHIAGGFGGLYVDSTDIIGNTTNVLIDKDIVNEGNRETFFGPGTFLDSAGSGGLYTGTNIYQNDTGGFLCLTGVWNASAGTLIRTGANYTGVFKIVGGMFFNAFTADGGNGHAIQVDNTGAQINISGASFSNIQGTGIICTAGTPATNILATNIHWITNPATKYTNVLTNTSIIAPVVTSRHAVLGRALNGTETLFGSALDSAPRAVWAMDASGGGALLAARFSNDNSNPWLELAKSRNDTLVSHTIVQNNDALGGVNFSGSDGSMFQSGARIRAVVNGTPAAGDLPTALEFYTRAQGGGSVAARALFEPGGTFRPATDNTYATGTSLFRWSVVYAATGTINTSDAREKENIQDSPLGLSFINALHPVKYTWKIGKNEVSSVEKQPAIYDEHGDKISDAVIEEVITPIPGTRQHYGLLAQEVKAALDAAGVDDFAGWVLDDPTDSSSRQGLRYDQFIAPLIKAVQELSQRVTQLESK